MNKACQIIQNAKRFADTIYNTCIIKVVPGCNRSWAYTTWKWGPLSGSSLITMKALHVWKIYITTEVFCSTNSMVHVTKRTRRRGACFPYPRRTWWAPPHSELLVTRQIYIHFQRAQPHSAVAACRRAGVPAAHVAPLQGVGHGCQVRTNAYASFSQSYRFRKKV